MEMWYWNYYHKHGWKLQNHFELWWKWFHILNPLHINMFYSMSHTHWEQAATSPVCQYVLCVMCYVLCVRCGGRVSTRTAPADSGPGPSVAPQHQHSYQQQQASCQGTGILFGTCRIKLNIQDLHHPIRLYIAMHYTQDCQECSWAIYP